MGKILRLIAVGCAGCAMCGCSTDGCTDLRSAIPKADFLNSATAEPVSLDSLQVHGVGAPGDSLILAAGTAAQSVYLPMRSTATSTKWCLSYKWKLLDDPRLNDTITFGYTSEPYFASAECGAMYRYRIKEISYTTHIIDSVKAVDSLITNLDVSQLQIFFRVSEEGGEQ